MATQKCLSPNTRIPCYVVNGFSALLFVPPAPKVLAEIKSTPCTAFYPFILRLELSHSGIENKVYYDLATTEYYFSNKERKRNDRPEVIGVERRVEGQRARPPIEMALMIKRISTKLIAYSILVSCRIFAYKSN